MDKLYYSYDTCIGDCKVLIPQIKTFDPDGLVFIARGGLILGHLLSEALDIRQTYTINSIGYNDTKKLNNVEIFNIPDLSTLKKVVIIDDIIDSGETMVEILKTLTTKFPLCDFKIATLFYKESALIQPNYSVKEAKEWIEFFWSEDLK